MSDYDDYDQRERFDADELYPEADSELLDEDGNTEECGACGAPATHYDNGEAVCGRHTVKDVYGV